METRSQEDCPHVRKDFRGTSSTSWQWTREDCGLKRSGHKKPGQSGQSASDEWEMRSSSARSSVPYGSPSEPRRASSRGYTNADRVLTYKGTPTLPRWISPTTSVRVRSMVRAMLLERTSRDRHLRRPPRCQGMPQRLLHRRLPRRHHEEGHPMLHKRALHERGSSGGPRS